MKTMTKKPQRPTGEVVYGTHAVSELLRAKRRRVVALYTTKPTPKGWLQIEKLLPVRSSLITYVSRDVLTRMADSPDHQGIVALAQPFPLRSTFFTPEQFPFLVMLDSIQDPRNVGAIMRSAYCTGAQGVVLVKKHAAPLTATVLKASAGLAEHLHVYVAASTQEAVSLIKKAGYNLYIATMQGTSATAVSFTQPCCIVIGSEGPGVTKGIERQGTAITLAQRAPDISYNASVAAGIILFLVGNQLKLIK